MRVTNTATYRNYVSSVNSVHAELNKSMNKVSSGRLYETAADSPLAYYKSKKIDGQYLEAKSQVTLMTDVKARVEQQEKGVYDIQQLVKKAKNDVVIKARSGTVDDTALDTLYSDLLQKSQTVVNDLRSQYQDYYIYGGNDMSTQPFALSADGMTLTFSHKFPGEASATNFKMELQEDPATKKYGYKLTEGDIDKLVRAMAEQGYIDVGYGDIRSRESLLDTYTGGMNVLTGITSDTIKTRYFKTDPNTGDFVTDADGYKKAADGAETAIMDALTNGPLGMIAQSAKAINSYLRSTDADGNSNDEYHDGEKLDGRLGTLVDQMTQTEHRISIIYSDLGNKYKAMTETEDRLNIFTDALTTQYKDTVGADPYESVLEMYNNQYAYSAALKVGSNLMQSSLFDFVK